jgi:hypothetical protein
MRTENESTCQPQKVIAAGESGQAKQIEEGSAAVPSPALPDIQKFHLLHLFQISAKFPP